MSSFRDMYRVFTGESPGCILCGDSVPLMEGIEAILPSGAEYSIVTDPPYGMGYVSSRRKEKHKKIGGDDSAALLAWICGVPATHSSYIFCQWDNLLGGIPRPKSFITWIKNNHGAGDLKHAHGSKTEHILFYPGRGHSWPGKRPTNILNFAKAPSKNHPTAKPVDLMGEIVGWTKGVVIDPFCGTGATCLAAKQLGRPYIGIELDEGYADVARRRLDNEGVL